MMKDPRDSRYYGIQKKARTTMRNLSGEELRAYLSYAEQMIEYVDAKARRGWIERKRNILALMEETQGPNNGAHGGSQAGHHDAVREME